MNGSMNGAKDKEEGLLRSLKRLKLIKSALSCPRPRPDHNRKVEHKLRNELTRLFVFFSSLDHRNELFLRFRRLMILIKNVN